MKKYISLASAFNLLALCVAIASGFGFGDFDPAPEVLPISMGIVAVVNLAARLIQDKQKTA